MNTFLVVLMVLICILLILSVLLQPSKDGGLSGIAAGGAQQLFSKQKRRGAEMWLHRITVILTCCYFILAILMIIWQ